MKRWLGVLALLLFLSGCSDTAPQTPTDGSTQPSEVLPTEPDPGLYDPENAVESQTAGAVKVYPLGDLACLDLAPMGKDILLFGSDTLTLLTGENLTAGITVTVPDLPLPDSGMVQIREDGVAYFDATEQAIVFLNGHLREVGRLQLTDSVTGGAYLTPDWKSLYYCTAEGVHVLDLDSGVSRLLKQQSAARQGITGGLLDGAVLRCEMETAEGEERTILISAQTGETLHEGEHLNGLTSAGDRYFLDRSTGLLPEWIFGRVEEQAWNFLPPEPQQLLTGGALLMPLMEMNAVVIMHQREGGICLEYYDLTAGLRSSTVELIGMESVEILAGINGAIWLHDEDALYRWEPIMSPTDDETVCTAPRYTREDPDEEGLAAIEAWARELERRYGVEILFWEAAAGAVPWDYSFETEYLTAPYEAGFAALEKAMAQFPDDFFRKAAEWTDSGVLRIVLVRGIYGGQEQENFTSAAGIQYNQDGSVYIALSLEEGLEQTFYHEVGHVIETRILSNCTAYYEWNVLNPSGFEYDNDYAANQDRQDFRYLEGNNRYFIDMHSMSFAFEDRSRILEYACMPGNESYFSSSHMQRKLSRICAGIREAFQLPEGEYIWEQYLNG